MINQTGTISMIINVNGNDSLPAQPIIPENTTCVYKVSLVEYIKNIEDKDVKLKPYIPINLDDVLAKDNNKIQFVGIPFSEVNIWKKIFSDSLFANLLRKCNNPFQISFCGLGNILDDLIHLNQNKNIQLCLESFPYELLFKMNLDKIILASDNPFEKFFKIYNKEPQTIYNYLIAYLIKKITANQGEDKYKVCLCKILHSVTNINFELLKYYFVLINWDNVEGEEKLKMELANKLINHFNSTTSQDKVKNLLAIYKRI